MRHLLDGSRTAAVVAGAGMIWLLLAGQGVSQEVTGEALGIELRRVPAGEFEMGYDHSGSFEELQVAFPRSITPRDVAGDERPRHRVRISRAFDLGAREVTVGQFRRFVEATGYRTTAETSGEGGVGFDPPSAEETERTGRRRAFARRAEFTWRSPGFEQEESHPVVCVSWEDAHAFCRWLSREEGAVYRLPTEAEWEYACRAGSRTWFSFGDAFRGRIQQFANVADLALEREQPELAVRQWLLHTQRDPEDGFAFTAPGGSFEANAWGLCDLHGNVWEWCEDRFLAHAYRRRAGAGEIPVDPRNEAGQDELDDWRVIRGGAWCTGPIMCRSGSRGFFAAGDAAAYVGFRVVREVRSR